MLSKHRCMRVLSPTSLWATYQQRQSPTVTKNLNDEQKSNQNKMRFTDEWEIQTIEAPGHQQEIDPSGVLMGSLKCLLIPSNLVGFELQTLSSQHFAYWHLCSALLLPAVHSTDFCLESHPSTFIVLVSAKNLRGIFMQICAPFSLTASFPGYIPA